MNELLPKLSTVPEGIHSPSDYLPYAKERLPPEIWRYLEEGSANNVSLQANPHAFDSIHLTPRPLSDVRSGHTKITLFGQTLAHPVILAPLAYQQLYHPHGESASAMAASAQEGQSCVSSLASQTLEDIISAAGQPLWFQLYWQENRERTLKLLQRTIAAGYNAIIFTVDAPVKQATIQLPTTIQPINLDLPAPFPALLPQQSQVFNGWMAQAPRWEDLAWLRDQTSLPLLVKGILHSEDAEKVINLGCDGLVVSNHGGRVLDGTPASLACLPPIVSAISGRGKVLFDSGIRNGRDIYKALALGADAVMVGRPYIWGLATAGALGVAHIIRLLRDELELTMALTGTASIQEITQEKIQISRNQNRN
ncbi:alpha-hydroxy acid oxidase [Nitrosomonas eutropha]|uniref:alpha-hydroxy acid oxidase n=1 Tax=Nitrosomonas eutropha TaxID=916 RepID=UPI0008C106E6|nr:alpha-hydroxy acid oxidase [Nitrosomonas eutropha]SEI42751.1 4-hydroxymandelate oxidase [Nitrosomonas eutropha]